MRTRVLIVILGLGLVAFAVLYWAKRENRSTDLRFHQTNATTPPSLVQPQSPQHGDATIPQTGPPTQSTPSRSSEQVPASIRPIVALNNSPFERQSAARALPTNLRQDEVEAVYAFLREPHAEDGNQVGQVLKNDLMDALCAQTPLPIDLRTLFAEIYRDRNEDTVIRDYAIQHVALLFERLDDPPASQSSDVASAKQKLEQVLWEAAAETESGIAGTALLALGRLSQNDNSLERSRIASTAMHLAQDESASEATRISALQVCARLEARESLPLLVQSARRASTLSLQISAIGSLGFLGADPEVGLLKEILAGENPRLKPVASIALHRVQERLSKR
jgi:hypothetical protein